MRQSVRLMFRRTRVMTVSGLRIGWLCDLELDLDTGHLCRIGISRFRLFRRARHWIHKNDIVLWEKGRILVNDAWIDCLQTKAVPVVPASVPAPSCFYDKRS